MKHMNIMQYRTWMIDALGVRGGCFDAESEHYFDFVQFFVCNRVLALSRAVWALIYARGGSMNLRYKSSWSICHW